MLLIVALVTIASCQNGWSPFLGGLTIVKSQVPWKWGNSSNSGVLGQINAPTYVWGAVQSYTVTAPVVSTIPLTNACEFTNNASFAGKIVLYSLGGYCSHAYKASVISQFGGVGAIFGELSGVPPSFDSMAQDQEIAPTLTIPVNLVAAALTSYLLGSLGAGAAPNATKLVVTITYQQDPLYAFSLSPSWLAIRILFSIWFGVCGIIALVKLVLFIREQGGIRASVPQICLFLCIFSCIMYILLLTLNWFGSRDNTSQLTLAIFRDWVTLVVWVMPVIVFPFYWGELVASSQPVTGLQESKIPIFIAIFIIEGFTLAVAVVKGLYGSNADLIRAQVCTIIILIGLFGIYFTIQGVRVIFALRNVQEGFAKTPVQRRTTFLFLGLAFLLFCLVISLSCSFAPYLGIMFPDFVLWSLSYPTFAAFAVAIITLTLSPKALKEAGLNVKTMFSGTASQRAVSQRGVQSKGSNESDDVEMKKKKKTSTQESETIDNQMVETKITI